MPPGWLSDAPDPPLSDVWESVRVHIGILGPLVVQDGDGREVDVAGVRLRRLLTRLALDTGRPVSAADLVDAVWFDEPPAESANALQSLVSRLRRVLGDSTLLRQSGNGYLLAVSRDDVDANTFVLRAAQARTALAAGDPVAAQDSLDEALALWRGEALVDADGADYATGPAARLEEQRLDALETRIEAALVTGRASEVVAELDELTRSHPLRERFTDQLMRALADTGRAAEALAAHERLRETLAEMLGTDPGPDVSATHLRVLRGEASGVSRPSAGLGPLIPLARRTNLPASLTSFVGRDGDRARVAALMRAGRLVTIVGPGGAGKTRIATEVARELVDDTPDGVWLVPLAPVIEEADLAEAFLAAIELREARVMETGRRRQSRDTTTRLVGELEDRTVVLVVDNCEHVIGGAARLVDEILRSAPGVRVIATSREPLGIDGEAITSLPPLALPPVGASADEAGAYAAVSLFVDRTASLRADFALDDTTVDAVVEIVRRLDGMPLAIELAAARARVLPVAEIARRITDRFRLLTGGSRATLPRHQTLRAVVDWSWELLTGDERLLAERLAVFPSGATAQSAQAICADDDLDPDSIIDLIDALAEKSIVVAAADESVADGGAAVRYRMLETIREYGLERLAARGESEVVRARHAEWFGALVERLDPLLRGRDQLDAIAELTAERDNILGALRFHLDRNDGAAALEMAVNLVWYWSLIGSNEETVTWLALVLEHPSDTPRHPGLLALAEAALALTAFSAEPSGTVPEDVGAPFMDEATWRATIADTSDRLEEHFEGLGSPAIVMRAVFALYSGDDARAKRVLEEGLASPDPWARAAVRMFRAKVAENDGDLETVRADSSVALEEFRAIGDRWGMASVLSSLGYLRGIDGDLDGAVAAYEEATEIMGAIGAREDEFLVATRLAGLHLRRGEHDRALVEFDRVAAAVGAGPMAIMAEAMRLHVLVARSSTGTGGGPGGTVLDPADRQVIEQTVADLERQVATQRPLMPLVGHSTAVVLTAIASAQIALGELDLAGRTLVETYRVAAGTEDGPILAAVGTVIAALRTAEGRPEVGAVVLGTSARVRGAEDQADHLVAQLTGHLRDALGEGYWTAYDMGWTLDVETARTRLDPAVTAGPSHQASA